MLPERNLEEGRKERSEPGVRGYSLGFFRTEEMTNDISEHLLQTFGQTLTLMKLTGQFFADGHEGDETASTTTTSEQ